MSRKATIAILAAALMALAAAPSGASAVEQCAPGTSGEYCETIETPGLSSKQHKASPAKSNGMVGIKIHCALNEKCKGTLQFLSPSGKTARKGSGHSARNHVALYATQNYSIKAKSTKTVHVRLNAKGEKALDAGGKLTVIVVAISEGVRDRIETLRIKAPHRTHAESEPGFTG